MDQVKEKQVINEIKQRVLCDRPSEKTMESSLLMAFDAFAEAHWTEEERCRALNRYEQSIQEKKTDHMLMMLIQKEKRFLQCKDLFADAIQEANMKDAFEKEYSIRDFLDLILHRFDLYQNKMRCIEQYRFSYILRHRYDTSYHQLQQERCRQFSPSLIIDCASPGLTPEQCRLLQRGPSYVPPCHLWMRPIAMKHLGDDRLKALYAPFKRQLNVLFSKYQVNLSQSMFLHQEIFGAFRQAFSTSIPSTLYARARYEQQLVDAIRKHLKEHQLILRRTADRRNVFYLGNRQAFRNLAQEYLLTTDQLEYCETVDANDSDAIKQSTEQMIRTIKQDLERLFRGHTLQLDLIEQLVPDPNKTSMPYLYFLPDVSSVRNQSAFLVFDLDVVSRRISN